MKKQVVTAVSAVAMLVSAAASAQPMQGGRGHMDAQGRGGCYPGEHRGDCDERLRVEQRSHHRYVWRNGHYEVQDDHGAVVAGTVLGFIMGAAIAGSASDRDYYNAHHHDRGWRDRCRSTYRSFDYRTGTYVGSDGYRHYCTR